ncbi:Hypothetical predicted protein [Pelobates cultripes]|uniref:Uncharacterized protein n=1 Tax=Pelobates cultripes TaxID=61616 RepID=A0AAD1SK24_PELCU|nr:Hypothetical predicted protein [Pelobates cultripes]
MGDLRCLTLTTTTSPTSSASFGMCTQIMDNIGKARGEMPPLFPALATSLVSLSNINGEFNFLVHKLHLKIESYNSRPISNSIWQIYLLFKMNTVSSLPQLEEDINLIFPTTSGKNVLPRAILFNLLTHSKNGLYSADSVVCSKLKKPV